jgi:hypothetical protein
MPVPTPAVHAEGENAHYAATGSGILRRSAPANAPRVPTAPAHAGEALKIRRHGPPGSPFMGRDASLGFRDLSLQGGYGFLCFRTGHLANREPSCFERLHCITVLLELNPVPSDVAIAVRDHVAAPATDP